MPRARRRRTACRSVPTPHPWRRGSRRTRPHRGRRTRVVGPRHWSRHLCRAATASRRSATSGVSVTVRSSDSATRAAVTTARDRAGSTWRRSHSHDGMARSTSGDGCTHSFRSRPAPGARSPKRCTSIRNPAKASCPVTFCSMIAGTRASMTRPLRPSRACGWRRRASASTGCRWLEVGPVVVGPQQIGQRRQRPLGAGAPGLRGDLAGAAAGLDDERGRALGSPGAAPDPTRLVDPERGVAPTTPMLAEDRACRTGPVGSPDPSLARLGRHGNRVDRGSDVEHVLVWGP